MKLVKGETLREVLDEIKAGKDEIIAQYPLSQLLTIFQKICDAVSYSHAKGVIHRDLKPENIMLGKYGEVLVMDWGLAKVLGGGRSALAEGPSLSPGQDLNRPASDRLSTQEGSIIGTPQYMAPEQAEGRLSDLDERTDIFSLGAILYSILTLRPPTGGTTLQEVLDNVRSGYIPPPVFYNASPRKLADGKEGKQPIKLRHCPHGLVPESLSAVVMKAMAKEPGQRYQTVTELQADLTKFQTGFATSAEGVSFGKQIKLLIRRNKAVVTTAFVAWLIITVILFWFVVRVTQERNRSAASLAKLRATAPTMAAQAKSLVEGQKFDEALEQIGFAIELDPTNPDFHLFKGHTLQALARLPDAMEAYRRVQELRPGDPSAKTNLELCEQLLTENGGNSALTTPLKTKLLDALLAQKRQADAVPLSRELKRDTDTAEALFKSRLKPLMTQPGWKSDMLKKQSDGTYSLDLRWVKIADLAILDGLPISRLDLTGTDPIDLNLLPRLPLTTLTAATRPITNLSGLKGLKLQSLSISGTKVSDLSPLAGMPLQNLYVNGSRVTDLGPVLSLPLKRLEAGATSIRDLRPLRDTPIEDLTISDTPLTSLDGLQGTPLKYLNAFRSRVEDLSPLRDTSVKELFTDQCYDITNLAPLMDCRQLEALTVPSHTSDIAFLKRHPSLKRISNHSIEYFGWTTSKMPTVAQFFEKHGDRLARQVPMEKQLAKFRQSLMEQGNEPGSVPRFVFDAEGELDIRLYNLTCFDISALQGVAVTTFYCNSRSLVDLSPLAGAPLKSLDIPSTGVSDLSFLKRVPLKLVRLHATRVKDLSPLRGVPLEKFLFDGKAGIDVSLLAEIPTLQEILVPEDATGILALKRLPKLRLLSYRPTNTAGLVPDQTADEFWKQHADRLARQAPMEKQLEKFRQSLITQGNSADKVPRFAFGSDGGLGVNLLGLKVSDITELRGVAVTGFICDAGISDLSPLRGAPLKTLYIPNTSVRDLSPLRGAPLERLWISRTPMTDMSALLDFPQLREVLLPAGAKNVDALKKLTKLTRISFNGSGPGGAIPAQTAAAFWKEYDAKQKK